MGTESTRKELFALNFEDEHTLVSEMAQLQTTTIWIYRLTMEHSANPVSTTGQWPANTTTSLKGNKT